MNHSQLCQALNRFKILDIKNKEREFIFVYIQKYKNQLYVGEVYYEWQINSIKYIVNLSNVEHLDIDTTKTFCMLIIPDGQYWFENHVKIIADEDRKILFIQQGFGKLIMNKCISQFNKDLINICII